jgi:hypothetical protein
MPAGRADGYLTQWSMPTARVEADQEDWSYRPNKKREEERRIPQI